MTGARTAAKFAVGQAVRLNSAGTARFGNVGTVTVVRVLPTATDYWYDVEGPDCRPYVRHGKRTYSRFFERFLEEDPCFT